VKNHDLMIVSFKASPPKNSKNPFLLNLVVGYDKSYHYPIKMTQNAMVILTFVDIFFLFWILLVTIFGRNVKV
jgi:hypothetical protein